MGYVPHAADHAVIAIQFCSLLNVNHSWTDLPGVLLCVVVCLYKYASVSGMSISVNFCQYSTPVNH